MGAEQFSVVAEGNSAREAFRSAVEEAAYESGHGGYTGTIAEKSDFKIFDVSAEFLEDLKSGEQSRYEHKYWKQVEDKWGPAGCFALGDNKYLFFGWASS